MRTINSRLRAARPLLVVITSLALTTACGEAATSEPGDAADSITSAAGSENATGLTPAGGSAGTEANVPGPGGSGGGAAAASNMPGAGGTLGSSAGTGAGLGQAGTVGAEGDAQAVQAGTSNSQLAAAGQTANPSVTQAGAAGTAATGNGEQTASGGTAAEGVAGQGSDSAGSSTGGAPEPTATCAADFANVDLAATDHSVMVDTSASWGELPHFWNTYGTGHLGLYLREDRGWGETLKAHTIDGVQNLGLTSVRQHGLFHDDIGIYTEVDGAPVYNFSQSDQIFDFFVEQGIAPIVELGSMPSALAADPSLTEFDWETGISPPKDFQLWQELVFEFVQHSVERYGAEVVIDWYFEVWNEPECCRGKFWSGTLDQYYELYDHAAAGVRAALPGGRVGGPVVSQPRELTSGTALGEGFLEHVTTENYAIPGTPAGLDFFAYHTWSFVEGSVNGYFAGLDLLDSFGFDNVGVAITEFGPTWEFGLDDEPQETRQGAAFVAQTYADIAQRCAQDGRRFPITHSWWVLSDVFEEGLYREDDPFIGCMGLISRENIKKPAYNAYKFLAQMGNEQLALSVAGAGDVGGMAARNANGGLQVLVYNGQAPGLGPADDTYYAVTDPHEIGVTVSGLRPDQPYDVTAYRIDDIRGNAYATWEAQGRPSMSEMTETDWQALRDTMDSPAEPLGQGLCGSSFTQSFSLPSPGVLFITFTPTSG